MNTCFLCIFAAVLAAAVVTWMVVHQQSLSRRAELMQEAIRNQDFTFRLPTNGLLPGERAMQEALNQLGKTIQQQVNHNEVEAWEKLTRVLTHEIMNATAPIASISQTMLARDDVRDSALEEGIRAIHSTSSHLITFVDSYRKLSQLQEPVPDDISLTAVIAEVRQLYPTLKWDVTIDSDNAHTDPNMLRQVLINLVKNAMEAGAHRIKMSAAPSALLVSNDGQPIPAEARSSIFIPFFTTKRTGNGIGLSLSRRMMTQQGGNLELLDHPQTGYHTTFQLTL